MARGDTEANHCLLHSGCLFSIFSTLPPRQFQTTIAYKPFHHAAMPSDNQLGFYNRRNNLKPKSSGSLQTWTGQNDRYNDSIVVQYLPAIASRSIQWDTNIYLTAQRAAETSREVVENEGVSHLTVDHLAGVYNAILETISATKPRTWYLGSYC